MADTPRDSVPDEPGEASPLLPPQHHHHHQNHEHHHHPPRPTHRTRPSVASIASSVRLPRAHKGSTIVNLLCFNIFIATAGSGLLTIPYTRVLEDVICREYYGVLADAEPIDEQMCKVNAIQSRLAFIAAIGMALQAIVGFLAAFPWGLVADRIGRRPVFALAVTGAILGLLWIMTVAYFSNVFPIEAVWLASAGMLLGGGDALLIAVVLSMITDATNEEERGMAFMKSHVGSLCGNLMSPAIASAMMSKTGPWPPLWLAVGLLAISAVSILFVPETLAAKQKQQQKGAGHPGASTPGDEPTGLRAQVAHTISRFRESLSVFNSPSLIMLLITALASQPVTYATLQFMTQFISKRYALPLSQTGYVQSLYGAAQILHALVLLPRLSRALLLLPRPTAPAPAPATARLRFATAERRDLYLARASYLILALGILALALAPTLALFVAGLVVMALGSAFGSLTRSTMSLYVDPAHRSRLFSVVGMVEVLGSVYAQPMLAGLFSLGMRLEGGGDDGDDGDDGRGRGWLGLPYFGLAALVAAAGCLLCFVRLPGKRGAGDGAPADEEEGE
ncbi:major facilitator superfamily transporter [Xylariaceae sp. FL0016]|nr:major facilitator superfamily transporter [Xylariaceae sp. FL0016]